MKIILFIPLLFSISCQGQQDILNQKMYVPTEVSYLGKKFPLALKDLTIMNYTYVNPLIARQVYDKSKEEFAILNSNILLSKKDCKHLIDNYVNKKTDSTYSEIYYNPYSNKKLIFQKISENTFKLKLEDDEMYLSVFVYQVNLFHYPRILKKRFLNLTFLVDIFLIERRLLKQQLFKN